MAFVLSLYVPRIWCFVIVAFPWLYILYFDANVPAFLPMFLICGSSLLLLVILVCLNFEDYYQWSARRKHCHKI